MFQDRQLTQEHEEAIQQASFIQGMHRVCGLPLIDGLSDTLVIPFGETLVQILSQVVADIGSGLRPLCHRSPHTDKILRLYHKLPAMIQMLMCYPSLLMQIIIP